LLTYTNQGCPSKTQADYYKFEAILNSGLLRANFYKYEQLERKKKKKKRNNNF